MFPSPKNTSRHLYIMDSVDSFVGGIKTIAPSAKSKKSRKFLSRYSKATNISKSKESLKASKLANRSKMQNIEPRSNPATLPVPMDVSLSAKSATNKMQVAYYSPKTAVVPDSTFPSGEGTYQQNVMDAQPGLDKIDDQVISDFKTIGLTSKPYLDQISSILQLKPEIVNGVWTMKEIETADPEVIQKRTKFANMKMLYSLLSDYVDGVHDITECFDFLEHSLPKGILRQRLKDLTSRLCGGGGKGRINVSASHSLQLDILNEYINALRTEVGLFIPNFDDPIYLTRNNCPDLFPGFRISAQPTARESGRGIPNYFQDCGIPASQIPKHITNNVIGAIDGCKGECDPNSKGPLTWVCNLYGIMKATITSTRSGSNLVSKIDIAYVDEPETVYAFSVKDEIVLDAVIDKLPQGFRTRNTEDKDYSQVITPMNPAPSNARYNMAVIALKTLCDKRLFQRATTDYSGANGSSKIAAISTTDWYVTLGHLLAYLNADIPYFPKIFFSGGNPDGYLVYSFDDNGSDELLKRYAYYRGYKSGELTKQLDYTTGWIQRAVDAASNETHEYSDFWDFIKTVAVKNQYQKWKELIGALFENVSNISVLESATANSEETKSQLINLITQIPIVVPNLSEFFEQLSEEEDTVFNGRLSRGIIINEILNKTIAKDAKLTESDLRTVRETIRPLESVDSINEQSRIESFAKQNKLNLPKLKREAGISSFPKFNHKSITIQGTNMVFEYQDEKEIIDVEAYNQINDAHKIAKVGNELTVPITAELLIKVAFNLVPASSRVITSDFIRELGRYLFDIVYTWLGLTENNREAFISLFLEATKHPQDTRYNTLWRSRMSSGGKRGGKTKKLRRRLSR